MRFVQKVVSLGTPNPNLASKQRVNGYCHDNVHTASFSCKHYMSKMEHQKLLWTAFQHITQINCVKVSALLLADGHGRQMSVEYNQVRLAEATYNCAVHIC